MSFGTSASAVIPMATHIGLSDRRLNAVVEAANIKLILNILVAVEEPDPMSVLQNPSLRRLFRKSGLKRVFYKTFVWLKRSGYEEKFSSVLLDTIRQGDCVWDVGANIGLYTKMFAERVGPSGVVIAIEPFDKSFCQLSAAVRGYPQVRCVKAALGAEERSLRVELVSPTSTANSLVRAAKSNNGEEVSIRTGKGLLLEGLTPPAILKIDVEGFEEDVLWGFRDSLRDATCRGVFLEVHYETLDTRGYPRTPQRLVSMLKDLGFRTRWLDRSHLAALR